MIMKATLCLVLLILFLGTVPIRSSFAFTIFTNLNGSILVGTPRAYMGPGQINEFSVVITNDNSHSTTLTSITNLHSNSSDVTVSVYSGVPQSIPGNGGQGTFYISVQTTSNISYGVYCVCGTANFNDTGSVNFYFPVTVNGGTTNEITVAPSQGVVEDNTSQNLQVEISNHETYQVSLQRLSNFLSNGYPQVTGWVSSGIPQTITANGGYSTFNVTVHVTPNAAIKTYFLTGTLELDNSVEVALYMHVVTSPFFLNSSSTTMTKSGFTSVISGLTQRQVSEAESSVSAYLMNSSMLSHKIPSSGKQTIYTNGDLVDTQYSTMLIKNVTTTISTYIIENTSWTAWKYQGNKLVETSSGTNYTLYELQQYSGYNVSMLIVFGTCGCAKADIRWVSTPSNELHLGDTISVSGISTFKQYLQALNTSVRSLSGYYSSSANSTLRTLGQRYAQILPSFTCAINNLPSSLASLSTSHGEGIVEDYNFWDCLYDNIELAGLIAGIVAAASACAAGFLPACALLYFSVDVLLPIMIYQIIEVC
jgi:hypothetical protein